MKDRPKAKGLAAKLRRGWRTLKNEQSSPTRLGVAVGLGVLLGCSPLYGFQMVLGLALAQVFKLNKLGVIAGAQISTPPFTPLVVIASIQLGHFLIHGRWLDLTLQMVKDTPGKELMTNFFVSFAVGGMTIGLTLGLAIGALTARVLRQRRLEDLKQPPITDGEMDELYEALGRLPRQFRHYGAWKVRLDPIYPLALPLLAYRTQLLDLGAGMGLLGVLSHARFPALKVRCVEWDVEKVTIARRLLEGVSEVTVEQGDARTVALGSPDAICLFDVLHYSPIEEQRAWLTRCVTALAPGGILVIRELDPERGRWGLAEQIERNAVKRGWNRGGGVHPWPISQLAQALRDLGLTVEVQPAGRGLFSANALVIARKA
ncbi:MAG: Glutamate synthase large chain [Myxococcaceae bacterium]|nr:Glutamate synthase large chain [Myxococcaceae bacterium]